MKTVFLIVGKTGSGKDTLVNNLTNLNKDYTKLRSFATRPRRIGESDSNHTFISPDEVDGYRDQMIAYTKIGEYEYFATYNQLKDSDFYIIDYEGVKYLRDCPLIDPDEVRFVTIYIKCDPDKRRERVLNYRKDDVDAFNKRCLAEYEQFYEMCSKEDYDYVITNDNLDTATRILEYIVAEEKIKTNRELIAASEDFFKTSEETTIDQIIDQISFF